MILDEVLLYNKDFPGGARIAGDAAKGVIIFTCVDPRLVDFVERAMGINRGDAAVLKNAGNLVTGDVLRSIAVVLSINEIKEIFVVGHTDCATARIKTYDFLNAMKKKGVDKTVFPAGDLREWLGAASEEHSRVRESAHALRKSPFIPSDVLVHGLLIDINNGNLEVVSRGDREKVEKDRVESQAAGTATSSQQQSSAPLYASSSPLFNSSSVSFDSTISLFGDGTPDRSEWAASSSFDEAFKSVSNKPVEKVLPQGKKPAAPARKAAPVQAKQSPVKQQSVRSTSKSLDTKKFGAFDPQAALEKKVERFEVWVEDLGIFGDDVKKEVKRLTGLAVDDVGALQRAVLSTKTPQEAQKFKRQLQSLGARAIIRRVKKTLRK